MPLTTYDLPTLLAQCRAYFRAQFPNADQSDQGYFGQLSAVFAMVLLEAQNELLQVDQDWFTGNELSSVACHVGHLHLEVNLIGCVLRNAPAIDAVVGMILHHLVPGPVRVF